MENEKMYKGIKVTYYMKDGSQIVDDFLKLDEPVSGESQVLKELILSTREQLESVGNDGGCIVCGNIYVRSKYVIAAKFELTEVLINNGNRKGNG